MTEEQKNTSSASAAEQAQAWERSMLERIATASIQEQAKARRWRTITRMAWLLFFVGLAWMLMFKSGAKTPAAKGSHTAVVEIRGNISDDAEASASNILTAAKAAFEDAGSKAVILSINSGGGSPVQAGIINDELKRMRTHYNKPLYAVIGDTSASGAYYVAVAADEIFVDKASMVGSIGVLMDGFGFTGAMEKIGVERRLITAGENKGFLDPYSPLKPEQRAHAQNMINQIHAQFIQVVRQGRGAKLKETEGMFSGLVWNGEQAVQMGLADQLGNVRSVARDVVKEEKTVDYTKRDNMAEQLARRFGVAVGVGFAESLQKIPALR